MLPNPLLAGDPSWTTSGVTSEGVMLLVASDEVLDMDGTLKLAGVGWDLEGAVPGCEVVVSD